MPLCRTLTHTRPPTWHMFCKKALKKRKRACTENDKASECADRAGNETAKAKEAGSKYASADEMFTVQAITTALLDQHMVISNQWHQRSVKLLFQGMQPKPWRHHYTPPLCNNTVAIGAQYCSTQPLHIMQREYVCFWPICSHAKVKQTINHQNGLDRLNAMHHPISR